MLTLTPVVCVLSGVAFSHLLELYLKEEENPQATESDSEDEGSGERNSRNMYDKVQVIGSLIVHKMNKSILLYACKTSAAKRSGSH
jgi:hypothetical protein